MPTYEYQCPECNHKFEKFEKITAKPETECPKCKKTAQRLFSAGSGFLMGSSASDMPSCAGSCPNAGSCPSLQKN